MTTPYPPRPPLDLPSAVELVESLLRHAHECRASDVHLVPTGNGLIVQFRCDGQLYRVGMVRPELTPTVIGRFKVLADLLVYRTDIPQEGRISLKLTGVDSEVRIATYPTLDGEKIAVRLDAQRGDSLRLDRLGLPDRTRQALAEALQLPEGVILLTGPSGSGKTTTLYSCLNYLVAQERVRNVVTVEDPIERRIDGIVQTEVNEAVGVTYGSALRYILRQDPEVILIGEIRDHTTASTAMEAGLTGHLIASTVHAGTAPQVFARLMEMHIEPSAITSVVRGVLSQRLLKKCCSAVLVDHRKCETCQGTGYDGRVLVAEWVPMSAPLRRAILDRADCEGLTSAAAEEGYRNLRTEADALVENGVTTPQEVDRVLGKRVEQPTRPSSARSERERSGGSDPVPSDARGDVPRQRADAKSTPPCIPRPEAGASGERIGNDGARPGGRDEPGRRVRQASEAPAPVVSGADSGGDS